MTNKFYFAHIIAILLVVLVSCSRKDDLTFSFEQAVGFSNNTKEIRISDSGEVEIGLSLNSKLKGSASVKISVTGINGFTYGVDYTTEPAAIKGEIKLNLQKDSTKAVIKYIGITKTTNKTKKILFQLEEGTNILLGQASTRDFNLFLTSTQSITISNNFENCNQKYSVPSGFIEVTVPGSKTDRGWGCKLDGGVDGSKSVRASAYGGKAGNDNAWLIMNPIDLSSYKHINISFDVNSVFKGPGKIVVQWSSNYDGKSNPTEFKWTLLSDINNSFPASGSKQWKKITGKITGITGAKFYLAFQFIEGTDKKSSSWNIDNLILKSN